MVSAMDLLHGAGAEMAVLPTGTVTFVLTDVDGSTKARQEHDDTAMRIAIARHHEIVSAAVERWSGARPEEQGEGDSTVAAFTRSSDAMAAALDAQRALQAESWPEGIALRVRMGIHTGEAVQRDADNYVGKAIILTARIRNAGHGRQILVSDSAAVIGRDALPEGAALVDLGAHRLKDLARPERIWSLVIPTSSPSTCRCRRSTPSATTCRCRRRRSSVGCRSWPTWLGGSPVSAWLR